MQKFSENREVFLKFNDIFRKVFRLMKQEDKLIKELEKGEKSEFIKDFDRDSHLKNLHMKNK